MGKYFGTDGVRGIANTELTPSLAFRLGRAGGFVLSQHYQGDGKPLVLVGRDPRISGQMLEAALVAGLLSVGIEVFQLGVIATPGVAFLTKAKNASAGVMISASHNPACDNGIKFFGSDGFKLVDQQELEIEKLLDQNIDDLPRPTTEGLGTLTCYPEGLYEYNEFLVQTIAENAEKLAGIKLVIDGANGATVSSINAVFADLETDFITIGSKPNGININDNLGSTHPEQLVKSVIKEEADLGLAFDGDGDRVIAVDENGKIVDGDKIIFIIAKFLKQEGKLTDNTIVTTVMSNYGLRKSLAQEGIRTIETRVGDRYVVEEMRKNGYNLGGEQSGHIILMDLNTTGDGMLSGIQLLNVMKQTGKKLSELASEVELYPQKLVNIRVSNADKNQVLQIPEVQAVLAKVRADLADNGRILVRPSGTEPLLRVMVEAATAEEVDHDLEIVTQVIQEVLGVDVK